jgi:hypothetical protein
MRIMRSIGDSPIILRLRESFSFFRAYARDIASFLLYATFPVIIVENFLSYYAAVYNLSPEIKSLPILIHFIYQPIYTGGLMFMISRLLSGESWSIKESLLVGLGCWLNLLVVHVISSALIILGLMAFIVPGLVVFARLSLAEFGVVLERRSPMDSLIHSNRITKRFTWQIIGSVVLLSALLLAVKILINIIIATLSLRHLLVFMVSELIIIILWSNITILLFRYYSLATNASQQHDIQPA